MPNISIVRCKREEYIKAWNQMYLAEKSKFNVPLFDGINPSLNKKPLSSETDNFCVVAYDLDKPTIGFPGKPVGIFCFVITPSKNIGKQFVVHPDYQKRGIGSALLLECEKTLKEHGFEKYYIGCSQYSAKIYKSLGVEPFSSDEKQDLYKFQVDLNRETFDEQYDRLVTQAHGIHLGRQSEALTFEDVENKAKEENPDYVTPSNAFVAGKSISPHDLESLKETDALTQLEEPIKSRVDDIQPVPHVPSSQSKPKSKKSKSKGSKRKK